MKKKKKVIQSSSDNNILEISKRNDNFTKKCAFNKIIKDEHIDYVTLNLTSVVDRVNRLVIYAYQFLKCWILHEHSSNRPLPKINKESIRMIFKVLIKKSKLKTITKTYKNGTTKTITKEITRNGPKPKGDNLIMYNSFMSFYDNEFSKLNVTLVDGTNLSQILGYVCVDIVTNVENNIKMNYFNYLKCFVNGCFKEEHQKIIDQHVGKEKVQIRKELRKELFNVKKDLTEGTMQSNEKYHQWINEMRDKVIPANYEESRLYDLAKSPQKYLPYMMFMNNILEKLNQKQFNVLPLRKSKIIKYIPIDTFSLVNILVVGKTEQYLSDIDKYKDEIWNTYFKMDKGIFKKLGYKFSHMLYTDCIGASLLFLSDVEYKNKTNKHKNMKIGRNRTEDEKIKVREDKAAKAIEVKNKEVTKIKENDDQTTKKVKPKKKQKNNSKSINLKPEFPYLDELTEEQLEKLKSSNLVYVDPGKLRLYTMINDEGKVLKYSNREYVKKTKRMKYKEKLTKEREKEGIIKLERELEGYNSKSVNYEIFTRYVAQKNKLDEVLLLKYENKKYRQYKWYAYINKKRAIDDLINKIKETYGGDCKLIMGDWSVSKQMRNFMPTPMIGLKRELRKKLEIINLDEYKTSKLDNVNEEETKNLYLMKKVWEKGTSKLYWRSIKMHSILLFKTENGRLGCMNRDKNAVKNMKKIVKYWFDHGDRPENFKRPIKVVQPMKNTENVDTSSR